MVPPGFDKVVEHPWKISRREGTKANQNTTLSVARSTTTTNNGPTTAGRRTDTATSTESESAAASASTRSTSYFFYQIRVCLRVRLGVHIARGCVTTLSCIPSVSSYYYVGGADAGDEGALWIVKPSDSSRGRGVYLLRELGELAYDRLSIVQRWTHPSHVVEER